MLTDLFGAIVMTASAATIITTFSLSFGTTTSDKTRIATIFTVWFTAVALLAASRILYYESGPLAVPGLGVVIALPVILMVLAVARSPALRAKLDAIPLQVLIGVNTVRALGFFFVVLYAQNRLPAPFAPVAGWGDIFVGVTAPLVAWLVTRSESSAKPIAWLWNLIGALDLIAAVSLGATSAPGPFRLIFADTSTAIMPTLPWLLIPGFLVPSLFATHIAVFYKLRSVRQTARVIA